MIATKIKMKYGCRNSQSLLEIDSVWIADCQSPGYYKKAILYDHLKAYPGSIKVNIWPYPTLIPEVSINGEKYVRSNPNRYQHDNLLELPRE